MRVKEGNKEKAIQEAAILIFAQNGFHNAKISQIADKAGVATGSIYLYFKNKEEILIKIFENLWEKIINEVENLAHRKDLNEIEKLDAMIDTFFDIFIENTPLTTVFVNEQSYLLQKYGRANFTYYERFNNLGEQIIDDGINKGIFNANLDTKVFRTFTLGGIRNILDLWAQDSNTYKLNVVRQNVKFILKKGILAL
jgi:TetR/AcrR family transcriptional regulator, fatty acid metabolism regulator protein